MRMFNFLTKKLKKWEETREQDLRKWIKENPDSLIKYIINLEEREIFKGFQL